MLPRYAHYGIVVVGRIAEIVAQVHFVVRVGEVVHPASCVGIYVYYIRVEEIPRPTKLPVDGFAHDIPVVVHVCRVFRYHHLFVRVDGKVGIEVAFLWQDAVFAQGGRCVVVNLVAIIQLSVVEQLLACNGIGYVQALNGALFVFVRLAWQRLFPVNLRANGVSVLVFGYHIGFVAAVSWVGQACAEDAVAYPIHKLLVLRVGHFGFIHPETIHRNVFHGRVLAPQTVAFLDAHFKVSTAHTGHSVGRWLCKAPARPHANHFTTTSGGGHSLAAETS